MDKAKVKLYCWIGGFSLLVCMGLYSCNSKSSSSSAVVTKSSKPVESSNPMGGTNQQLREYKQENAKLINKYNDMKDNLSNLTKQITELKNKSQNSSNSRVNKAQEVQIQQLEDSQRVLEDKIRSSNNSTSNNKNSYDIKKDKAGDKIIRITDMSYIAPVKDGNINNSSYANGIKTDKEQEDSILGVKSQNDKTVLKPKYQIPKGSTMAQVYLRSALVGETPLNNKLVQPLFPFQAIVGKKDLYSANGYGLPQDLKGMILNGYSIGWRTMSCARAYVTSITFVFSDGTYYVVGDDNGTDNSVDSLEKSALGYIANMAGIPCVSGTYATDAAKVLTVLGLMGGLGQVGEGLSQAQVSTQTTGAGTSQFINGSSAAYVGGQVLGGASKDIKDWYLSRVKDSMEAVIVPASSCNWDKDTKKCLDTPKITKVVFTATKDIKIYHDKNNYMENTDADKSNLVNLSY